MAEKKIYISGKITGLELSEAKRLFEEVESAIHERGDGSIPVNPFKVLNYHPDHTWEDYMLADIKALFGCHEMHMLPNWKESRGARIEHAIGIENGLKIIYL